MIAPQVISFFSVLLARTAASSYQENIITGVKENGGDTLLWEPGVNFASDTPHEYLYHLTGSHDMSALKANINCSAQCAAAGTECGGNDDPPIPENFDARVKYPQCESIGKVHDQGACKSDYAISTTSAITDRICIASGGKIKTPISAQHVISCCQNCGRGCKGGHPMEVWSYFVRRGISSGGAYSSNEGCQPYLIEPVGFSLNKFYGAQIYKTPKCKRVCYNEQYGKARVRDDLHKGKKAHRLCCCMVKDEIMIGPITTSMLLFEDFLTYKSGIYHHVYGKRLGHIAVKVIGWGVENKVPYWLAVNSWSEEWGDKGTFKILKKDNGCEFDDYFYTADI